VTTSAFRDHTHGRIGILQTLDDITSDKAATDQIHESEARFRSLFDSTPVGIALVRADWSIMALNPALEQLRGFSTDEIIDKKLSHFRSPIHQGTGLNRSLLLATSGEGFSIERLLVRKDDSEVWTHVVTAPVRNERGEFLFGVRMIVDISQRKEVERLKDEFLGMVNHELRTPLTAIEAGIGLVASGALGSLPENMQRMLDIASENSSRLTRLVNDVLDLERMTAGRIELEPVACNASALIEQATQAASAIADGAGVTIEPTSTDMRLVADPDRIIQTLTNLIANAVKFSPSGSSVPVGVTKAKGGIRFSVADHGRGIPANEIPLIFNRFHQVERGDSRNQGGTGLGLAICQWIVEQHGGHIWVDSAVEHGSTFFFALPERRQASR
jgi:PAS domain S-box-containing protein